MWLRWPGAEVARDCRLPHDGREPETREPGDCGHLSIPGIPPLEAVCWPPSSQPPVCPPPLFFCWPPLFLPAVRLTAPQTAPPQSSRPRGPLKETLQEALVRPFQEPAEQLHAQLARLSSGPSPAARPQPSTTCPAAAAAALNPPSPRQVFVVHDEAAKDFQRAVADWFLARPGAANISTPAFVFQLNALQVPPPPTYTRSTCRAALHAPTHVSGPPRVAPHGAAPRRPARARVPCPAVRGPPARRGTRPRARSAPASGAACRRKDSRPGRAPPGGHRSADACGRSVRPAGRLRQRGRRARRAGQRACPAAGGRSGCLPPGGREPACSVSAGRWSV